MAFQVPPTELKEWCRTVGGLWKFDHNSEQDRVLCLFEGSEHQLTVEMDETGWVRIIEGTPLSLVRFETNDPERVVIDTERVTDDPDMDPQHILVDDGSTEFVAGWNGRTWEDHPELDMFDMGLPIPDEYK